MRLEKLGFDIKVGVLNEIPPSMTLSINGTPFDALPGQEKKLPERKLLHEVNYRDCAPDKRIM